MFNATRGLCFLLLLAPGAVVSAPSSLSNSIEDGEISLAFRYRLEIVDQDGLNEMAAASTLRTRLSFETGPVGHWSGLIEVDNVSYVGHDSFNSLRNGRTQYPVVADPKGTDVNQVLIRYRSESRQMAFGRQRINIDNQRFIGGVGWRQNEQTYDGLSFAWAGDDGETLSYHYIGRVHRVFGPDDGNPPDTLDSDSHLLHGSMNLGAGKLTGYGYILDFGNAADLSSRTWGASYSANFETSNLTLPLRGEFAHQVNNGDNPVDYSANYWHITFGIESEVATVNVGFEVLEADDDAGSAFVTPLATLHKFNGWADKFLGTPAHGLEDTYITVSIPFGNSRIGFTWHDFDAEPGSADYGNEVDLSFSASIGEHVDMLIKAARYSAETFATDTSKVWVMFNVSF